MGALTEKTTNEHLYKLDELHTVKVIEEIQHVSVPVYEEKIVEVPVYRDVEVEVPVFIDMEVETYSIKEKGIQSLVNKAVKPLIDELHRLEKQRMDLGEIVTRAVDRAVAKAFADLVKKLS